MGKADRAKARSLYVQESLPPSAVAARLGVSERSVARWKSDAAKDGDCWDRARVAAKLSKEGAEANAQECLAIFLQYHRTVLDDVQASPDLTALERIAAITSLADAYTKYVRASALAAPQLSQLAVASEVIQRLTSFVAEKHTEAAPALLAVLEPFGAEMAKVYG